MTNIGDQPMFPQPASYKEPLTEDDLDKILRNRGLYISIRKKEKTLDILREMQEVGVGDPVLLEGQIEDLERELQAARQILDGEGLVS